MLRPAGEDFPLNVAIQNGFAAAVNNAGDSGSTAFAQARRWGGGLLCGVGGMSRPGAGRPLPQPGLSLPPASSPCAVQGVGAIVLVNADDEAAVVDEGDCDDC